MKKIGLVLLLVLGLMLCGCEGDAKQPNDSQTTAEVGTTTSVFPPITDPTTPNGTTTSDTPGDSPSQKDPSVGDPTVSAKDSYTLLTCREPNGYRDKVFGVSGSTSAFRASLPREWSFSEPAGGSCAILRGGNEIGRIQYGALSTGEWETVKQEEYTRNGITLTTQIQYDGNEVAPQFQYHFQASYAVNGRTNQLHFTIDYTEFSEYSIGKLQSTMMLQDVATNPRFGVISNPKARQSVLILGNSFINSSQIGSILQSMCNSNNRNLQVRAISRGYAEVSTYASDSSILSEIRSGQYGAVFICGLYSEAQAVHLATLQAACNVSGTRLVIFPAHNESANAILHAKSMYPDLLCLDWKAEIEALISSGVDLWDFCVNDQHKHSTPLGGYVGAHMIYRAIFGSVPAGSVSGAISQNQVNSLLGDYVSTGSTRLIAEDSFILLS